MQCQRILLPIFLPIVIISSWANAQQPSTIDASVEEPKRSWKCVIMDMARINKLNTQQVAYHFEGQFGPAQNRTFKYRLVLGTEQYDNSGTSKKKAQDSVSKMAFQHTKYKKPQLTPQLCVIKLSEMSILQDWASQRKMSLVFYVVGETKNVPKEYIYECLLNGTISTQGRSTRKKEAKSLAAQKMIAKLSDMHLTINSFAGKLARYNTSEAVSQHPVSRLYEIQSVKQAMEPIFSISTVTDELDNGRPLLHYVVSVKVDHMEQTASADNVRKARELAARYMLHQMGFLI